MFKKPYLGMAVAAAIAMPGVSVAEVETSVILKNETAVFVRDGQRTGEGSNTLDTSGEGRDLYKFENSARIFFNGDIGEESSWHGELNVIYDAAAISDYKGHENYSQHDWFRELYVDTNAAGWDFRIGKQQQVWGTADGIKLLDIINPTDYREFSQNAMEDSRIPVWMVSGERYLDSGGNVQFIIADPQPNRVAGMNKSNGATASVVYNNPFAGSPSDNSSLIGEDSGHGFIMLGVDTITGQSNGFFNIGAAMGAVTRTFFNGNFITPQFGGGTANPGSPELGTVGGYTAGTYEFDTSNPLNAANCTGQATGGTAINVSGANCLSQFTQATNQFITNLIDTAPVVDNLGNVLDTTGAGWDPNTANSTWEFMPSASFATFNPFVDMSTKYVRRRPGTTEANFGMRFRNSLDNGLNFGLNYLYAYDPNPVVNIHWADPNTGERLIYTEYATVAGTTVGQLSNQAGTQFYGANVNYTNGVGGDGTIDPDGPGPAAATDNLYVGATPTDVDGTNNAGPAQLVFEERLTRVHNIGGSFDYAFDTDFAPVVLRGEVLYQMNVHQPVVDQAALGRGNLTSALTTQESDFLKYVIGVDVTVATNLFVSGQFIQFRNLDYVDEAGTCTYFDATGTAYNYSCPRYTADPSTMHLSNDLQKGWENKNFYSLYLSKPFGESELGRWNNILIYEAGGGFWDRLDAEYSLSDEIVLTGEINMYWGDENTTFGQFKNSSNIQVGMKWIME